MFYPRKILTPKDEPYRKYSFYMFAACVPPKMFGPHPDVEWTHLFLQVCYHFRLVTVADTPSARLNVNTPRQYATEILMKSVLPPNNQEQNPPLDLTVGLYMFGVMTYMHTRTRPGDPLLESFLAPVRADQNLQWYDSSHMVRAAQGFCWYGVASPRNLVDDTKTSVAIPSATSANPHLTRDTCWGTAYLFGAPADIPKIDKQQGTGPEEVKIHRLTEPDQQRSVRRNTANEQMDAEFTHDSQGLPYMRNLFAPAVRTLVLEMLARLVRDQLQSYWYKDTTDRLLIRAYARDLYDDLQKKVTGAGTADTNTLSWWVQACLWLMRHEEASLLEEFRPFRGKVKLRSAAPDAGRAEEHAAQRQLPPQGPWRELGHTVVAVYLRSMVDWSWIEYEPVATWVEVQRFLPSVRPPPKDTGDGKPHDAWLKTYGTYNLPDSDKALTESLLGRQRAASSTSSTVVVLAASLQAAVLEHIARKQSGVGTKCSPVPLLLGDAATKNANYTVAKGDVTTTVEKCKEFVVAVLSGQRHEIEWDVDSVTRNAFAAWLASGQNLSRTVLEGLHTKMKNKASSEKTAVPRGILEGLTAVQRGLHPQLVFNLRFGA